MDIPTNRFCNGRTGVELCRWSLGGAFVLLVASLSAAIAEESGTRPVIVLKTNWASRVITNVIEVTVPQNVFVNEFRTNHYEVLATNVVDVFQTNVITKQITNLVFRTQTNFVVAERIRTNRVVEYHTNWATVTFTNVQSVTALQTNWVNQQTPNGVQVETRRPSPAPSSAVPLPVAVAPAPSFTLANGGTTAGAATVDGFVIEASGLPRGANGNIFDVLLSVRGSANPTAAIQVQDWRVERVDGTVLCFGRQPEFKRELPVGNYRIETNARLAEGTPFTRVRAVLELTLTGVAVRPALAAR